MNTASFLEKHNICKPFSLNIHLLLQSAWTGWTRPEPGSGAGLGQELKVTGSILGDGGWGGGGTSEWAAGKPTPNSERNVPSTANL